MHITTRTSRWVMVPRLISYLSILAFPISWLAHKPQTINDGITLGFILAISLFGPLITLSVTRSSLSRSQHNRRYPTNTVSFLEWRTVDTYTGPNGPESFEQAIPGWPEHNPA